MEKIVAEIGSTIRIVDTGAYFKIEELVTDKGHYILWITPIFTTLWRALDEVSRELNYRSKDGI
jgi:hypothetical protein